ncbi:hypothetical protein HZA97_03515 [Candidatus Woesearchaeota archaeon]|nr:hypothetical protein [Candidatus Woesearchaeota archaeon]
MKIAVILGGSYNMYLSDAGFFSYFENKTKLKLSKTAQQDPVYPSYFLEDKNTEIAFFGCFGLYKNFLLDTNLKYTAAAGKESHPPTSDIIVDKVKKYNPDIVLFFGICGNLDNEANVPHFPKIFQEVVFQKIFPLDNAVPENSVSIKNILGYTDEHSISVIGFIIPEFFGEFEYKKSIDKLLILFTEAAKFAENDKTKQGEVIRKLFERNVSSLPELNTKEIVSIINYWRNQVFLNYFQSLREYGSLIDMEAWMIAASFKNRKIGMMLYSSDNPAHDKEWGDFRHAINWKKFDLVCTALIEEVVKNYC